MCWSNNIAIPIVLKKPLRVYKVGISTILYGFISSYQNFMYLKGKILPTIEINPIFERLYPPFLFIHFGIMIDFIYMKVIIHI